MISLPTAPPFAGSAHNSSLVLTSCHGEELELIIHETSHVLDVNAYGIAWFSLSSEWKAAYDLDPDVPDDYSLSHMVEDFAQVSVLATYEINLGMSLVHAQLDSIRKQVNLVEEKQKQAS